MRLFTALDVPKDWRHAATEAQARLARQFDADLRFVRRDQLHVTVRFLGEVPPERATALAAAIEAAPPFEVDVALAPAGTFGPPARTAVTWLGVAIDDAATVAVLGSVDHAIRAAGLEPSDQRWRPHLTLARVRRQVDAARRREIAGAVAELPAPLAHSALVRSVSLFHSQLGGGPPNHKLLARSAVS